MNIQLGSLTFSPAAAEPNLLASPVAIALQNLPQKELVAVSSIDPTLSDTAAFCEKYGTGPEIAANCVIVLGKNGEERKMAAVILLATTRGDVNGKVREALGVKKISFAPMEEAVGQSGMEFGAITPIGLPSSWPILIDSRVIGVPQVIIGSGLRKSKLTVPGSFLTTLPNTVVIEGLANPRE